MSPLKYARHYVLQRLHLTYNLILGPADLMEYRLLNHGPKQTGSYRLALQLRSNSMCPFGLALQFSS